MDIRRGWTRQVAATALLVAACGAAGTLVACNDSTGPGVAGSYQLTAVNGHALPATVSWATGEQTIGAGGLMLEPSGTFTLTVTRQDGQGLVVRGGSWTSSGAHVVLTYAITPGPSACVQPLPDDTATRAGGTLTLPSSSLPPCTGGATFTFTR
jgi:hypothetical protein